MNTPAKPPQPTREEKMMAEAIGATVDLAPGIHLDIPTKQVVHLTPKVPSQQYSIMVTSLPFKPPEEAPEWAKTKVVVRFWILREQRLVLCRIRIGRNEEVSGWSMCANDDEWNQVLGKWNAIRSATIAQTKWIKQRILEEFRQRHHMAGSK